MRAKGLVQARRWTGPRQVSLVALWLKDNVVDIDSSKANVLKCGISDRLHPLNRVVATEDSDFHRILDDASSP